MQLTQVQSESGLLEDEGPSIVPRAVELMTKRRRDSRDTVDRFMISVFLIMCLVSLAYVIFCNSEVQLTTGLLAPLGLATVSFFKCRRTALFPYLIASCQVSGTIWFLSMFEPQQAGVQSGAYLACLACLAILGLVTLYGDQKLLLATIAGLFGTVATKAILLPNIEVLATTNNLGILFSFPYLLAASFILLCGTGFVILNNIRTKETWEICLQLASLESQRDQNEKLLAAQTDDLRLQYNFLQSVLNSVEAQICILDSCGTVLQSNARWDALVKQHSVGFCFPGENYLAICRSTKGQNGDQLSDVADAIENVAFGNRTSCQVEYFSDTPDGRRWFEIQATPINDSLEGTVVLLHRETTVAKQQLEELNEAKRDAENANRSKANFWPI